MPRAKAVGDVRDYSFRITIDSNPDESFIGNLKKALGNPSTLILYRHEADDEVSRNHYHGLCAGCPIKTHETVAKRIAAEFNLVKTDYMVKSGHGKSPFQYMSKGRLDPVYNEGFDVSVIESAKREGFDKKKDTVKVIDGKIVIERDVKKDEKKTDIEMIQQIAHRCDSNAISDTAGIAHEIVKTWKQNNKRGHARLLEEWIDAVRYNSNHADNWIEQVVQSYEARRSRF